MSQPHPTPALAMRMPRARRPTTRKSAAALHNGAAPNLAQQVAATPIHSL